MRTATPIFYLFLDNGSVDVVGDGAVNFDPAVHRAGVHDDGVIFGMCKLFGRPARNGDSIRVLRG